MEDFLNLYDLTDIVAPNSVILAASMPDGEVNLIYTKWKCRNCLVLS